MKTCEMCGHLVYNKVELIHKLDYAIRVNANTRYTTIDLDMQVANEILALLKSTDVGTKVPK